MFLQKFKYTCRKIHGCKAKDDETLPPLSQQPTRTKPTIMSEKASRIPPIIKGDSKSWMTSMDLIQIEKVQIKHYITKRDGIQVFPTVADDYRSITSMLDEGKTQYYIFNLQEQKKLKLFHKDIPQNNPKGQGVRGYF